MNKTISSPSSSLIPVFQLRSMLKTLIHLYWNKGGIALAGWWTEEEQTAQEADKMKPALGTVDPSKSKRLHVGSLERPLGVTMAPRTVVKISIFWEENFTVSSVARCLWVYASPNYIVSLVIAGYYKAQGGTLLSRDAGEKGVGRGCVWKSS